MLSAPEMIQQWIDGGRNRNASALAKECGLSKAAISLIQNGKKPSRNAIIQLGKVLPPMDSLILLIQVDSGFRKLFWRCVQSSEKPLY